MIRAGRAAVEQTLVKPVTSKQLRQAWWMGGLCFLFVVSLPFVPLFFGKGKPKTMDLGDWFELALMCALAAVIPLVVIIEKGARLTISEQGLRMDIELPVWLSWLRSLSAWSLEWSAIQKVNRYGRPPRVVALVVSQWSLPKRLDLWGWVPVHQARAGQPASEIPKDADLNQSPIWRVLEERGLLEACSNQDTMVEFDLAAHPTTRLALGACAALAGIGFVLTFVESETYIADGYSFLFPHIGGGVIGLCLFWRVLRSRSIDPPLPPGVPLGLGWLAGICTAVFSYGAVVSMNRVLVPAVPVTYTISAPCTTLTPEDPGLPRIIWSSGFSDYWCQYKAGTEFVIPVRHGAFGLYQFDQGAYVEKIWAFRKSQREGQGSAD